MGSPQPPPVMPLLSTTPEAIAKPNFASLPLDLKYLVLQRIDSFATLDALLEAGSSTSEEVAGAQNNLDGLDDIIAHYNSSIHGAISATEFKPLIDGLLAVGMIDAASANTISSPPTTTVIGGEEEEKKQEQKTPALVSHLEAATASQPVFPLDAETRGKLHALTTAANGLAELYFSKKQHKVGRPTLLGPELVRFRRALFRCTTFFELYKERKAISFLADNEDEEFFDEDDEWSDDPETAQAAQEKSKFTPRNVFLSRFSHQEVLEMDCVREFLTELAQELAEYILEGKEYYAEHGDQIGGTTSFEEYAKSLSTTWGWSGLDILSPKKTDGDVDDVHAATTTSTTTACMCIINYDANDTNVNTNDNNIDITGLDNTNNNNICACNNTLVIPTTTTATTTDTDDNTDLSPATPPSESSPSFLQETLLLMGPIPLYHLHNYLNTRNPSESFPHTFFDTIKSLAPTRPRDIFEDEIYRYWKKVGYTVYGMAEGEMAAAAAAATGHEKGKSATKVQLPRGFKSVFDAMNLEKYELAVLREGGWFREGGWLLSTN
ncbi:hypothetical protein DFH27DRAFT_358920 [Peziza echinospora]|nr:hypothetical protein DFH27DRAFT_358920 [Peziza echinospora]